MATASAITNWFGSAGQLMAEGFADVLDAWFREIRRRMWSGPVEGLKYWDVQSTNRAYEKYSNTIAQLRSIRADEDVASALKAHYTGYRVGENLVWLRHPRYL